eukprot:1730815-Rhodomonas_salina.5
MNILLRTRWRSPFAVPAQVPWTIVLFARVEFLAAHDIWSVVHRRLRADLRQTRHGQATVTAFNMLGPAFSWKVAS